MSHNASCVVRRLVTVASLVFVCSILSGCSETLIGKEPANMKAMSNAERSGNLDSANWMRDVPRCERNLGVIAVLEQESEFPSAGTQQNSIPILRYLIQKSGCFTIVDRGAAISKLDAERGYSRNPEPARFRQMDYLLSARLIFQDSSANEASLSLARTIANSPLTSTSLGSGMALSVRKTEVNALLLLTDVRSSVQLMAEQGSATKIDTSISAYSSWANDSTSGKTVSAALFDAYSRMVDGLKATDLKKRRPPM